MCYDLTGDYWIVKRLSVYILIILRAKGKKSTKQNGVKNLLFMQKLHLGNEMKNNLIFKGLVLL